MDSVTQAALGAAIGEVTLGKTLGNKAILWGAVLATIPDLDVLANPLMDNIAVLGWHRGISHSAAFAAAATPVFGWIMNKIHKDNAPLKSAMLLSFLAIFTHAILDCFTMYGTQLLAPFSDVRIAWNNIFIIDPFYTVPLAVAVISAMFLKRGNDRRRRRAWIGLYLSSGYLVLSLFIKLYIDSVVVENLERKGIAYTRFSTNPAPLTILLWRSVAETRDGYYIGYHSIFDSKPDQPLLYVQRNEALIDSIRNTRAVQTLLWFSEGYYYVEEKNRQLVFYDIRFGEFSTPPDGGNFGYGEWKDPEFMFAFVIRNNKNTGWTFDRGRFGSRAFQPAFSQLVHRIAGL